LFTKLKPLKELKMSSKRILKILVVTTLTFGLLFTLGVSKCQKVVEEAVELEESSEDEITEDEIESVEETLKEEETIEVVIYDITFHSNLDDLSLQDPSAYCIYAAMLDGSEPAKVYDSDTGDFDPSFNSDHTKIVFSSYMDGDDDSDIYIYDLESDSASKIVDREGDDLSPDFGPNDSQIVFSGFVGDEESDNMEIFTVNADGSNLTQITDNSCFDGLPDFSPDENQLMITSNRDGANKIYTMDADGSNIMQRTNFGDWNDFDGSFFPGEEYAVFVSDRNENYDIFVVPLEDNQGLQLELSMGMATNISNDPANDLLPAYGPDENVIAFSTDREHGDYNYNIYTVENISEHSGEIKFTEPEPVDGYGPVFTGLKPDIYGMLSGHES
jgi:Tol biopolymer transport system component